MPLFNGDNAPLIPFMPLTAAPPLRISNSGDTFLKGLSSIPLKYIGRSPLTTRSRSSLYKSFIHDGISSGLFFLDIYYIFHKDNYNLISLKTRNGHIINHVPVYTLMHVISSQGSFSFLLRLVLSRP